MASAEEQDPRVLFPVKPGSVHEASDVGGGESASREPEGTREFEAEPAVRPRRQQLAPVARPSAFQRSVGAIRTVIPIVQKILPLLDGNIASAVSNLLTPHHHPEPVNLAPLENAVVRLHGDNLQLRNQVAEHNTMLKRVDDQLGLVKEATDRNSIGQQELLDDLHGLRKKVHVFAWIGLLLLVISIGVNVFLFLRLHS
ncbi:MAG TPA: hypothetical protein VKR52_21995 [Terracidiphilus sp.]|nr:hypothetical protein [Terracidiphilus sp.]